MSILSRLRSLLRRSASKPLPRDLVLGEWRENPKKLVRLRESLRPTHMGIVGLSGTGKSYFIESLVRQDVDRNTGFVLFDVHGDLADRVLEYIAARAAADRAVLYRTVIVEPFDASHTIGFNPLEQSPDTSPFLQAQGLAHILRVRWETHSFGARTEELLQNALYVLSAHGLTLLELPDLLINGTFRRALVDRLPDRSVADYWKGRYENVSEAMRASMREPVLTRISAFVADPQIRDVVGQAKSTFSFRNAIRQGLYVVVNLSKGKLGEGNAAVLGSLLFTKLELEVMAQARVEEAKRRLFAVYADELQNLVDQNFATLIAEARKYRVSVTAGHQFWGQLPPDMRSAMLAVSSRVCFRLHHHDAQELAGELGVPPGQLTTLARGEAVFRAGAARPIRIRVRRHEPVRASRAAIEWLRSCSRWLYQMPRSEARERLDKRRQQQARQAIDERATDPL